MKKNQISFNDIPKFVINLDRREDRLTSINDEFNYIGWKYERFPAIDTGSYIGCGLSHKEIAQICIDKEYEYAMVFEDDMFFMPYIKHLLPIIELELSEFDWDFFHLGPSLHRPLEKLSDTFLDLTNLPPKDPYRHRGIFGTTAFILTRKACEYIVNWDTDVYMDNINRQIPIDEYMNNIMYPRIKSITSFYPLVSQIPGRSDINKTYDTPHYIITYNWNQYTPFKLDNALFDYEECKRRRK